MKINPDDPWYPIRDRDNRNFDEPGVTIRLKLAAGFACSLSTGWSAATRHNLTAEVISVVMANGLRMADALIERANRDEQVAQEEIIEIDEDGAVHLAAKSPTALKSTAIRDPEGEYSRFAELEERRE